MKQHKVSELEGALLDAAVAKALGATLARYGERLFARWDSKDGEMMGVFAPSNFSPSTNWIFGGQIIERERIGVAFDGNSWCAAPTDAEYESYFHLRRSTGSEIAGSTPLIAAMRAFVASKFGDEVDLP